MPTLRKAAALAGIAVLLTACYGDTESAENVTSTSARLTAWGVPETSSTDFYFDYGASPQFGQTTPVRHPDGLTPGRTYPIWEDVSGLTPNKRYYFRLCGKERTEPAPTCGTTRSFITTTFTNPPKASNFNSLWKTYSIGDYQHGDTKIIRADGKYYGSGSGCTLRVSTDLLNWDYVAKHDDGTGHQVPTEVCGGAAGAHPALMEMQPKSGQKVNFWGTEVSKVGNRWVLVTSGNRHHTERGPDYTRGAIWVGTADRPEGPYTWAADATLKHIDSTMIDPSIFADPKTGKVWLLWTQHKDFPSWSRHNQLLAVELDPADLTAVRAGATPTVLMSTDVDPQPRELAFPNSGQRIIEGSGAFVHNDRYYFYYAAGTVEYDYQNWGGAPYTLNVASSATFPARFTKAAEPVLSGGNGWRLPGHGAFFQDGDGTWWATVSPYRDGERLCEPPKSDYCGWTRTVILQKSTYHAESNTFSIYDGILKPGPVGIPVPD